MATRIRNKQFMQQLKDFSGFGKYCPGDIDLFMEVDNRAFVFAEFKYKGGTLSTGQRIGFERLIDALHNPPEQHAILFVCEHQVEAQSGRMIKAHAIEVVSYRFNKNWIRPEQKAPLSFWINNFFDLAGVKRRVGGNG